MFCKEGWPKPSPPPPVKLKEKVCLSPPRIYNCTDAGAGVGLGGFQQAVISHHTYIVRNVTLIVLF